MPSKFECPSQLQGQPLVSIRVLVSEAKFNLSSSFVSLPEGPPWLGCVARTTCCAWRSRYRWTRGTTRKLLGRWSGASIYRAQPSWRSWRGCLPSQLDSGTDRRTSRSGSCPPRPHPAPLPCGPPGEKSSCDPLPRWQGGNASIAFRVLVPCRSG